MIYFGFLLGKKCSFSRADSTLGADSRTGASSTTGTARHVGQGIPCSQETKFIAVFYDAYRYWKHDLDLQVTTSRFYIKNTGISAAFTITFGRCNLGLPFTFLGYMGIIQQCYACSLLGTYQSLPNRRFKHTVTDSTMEKSRIRSRNRPIVKIIFQSYSGADSGPESLTAVVTKES